MRRRKFVYWVGAGLFGIGESLGVDAFDRLAAAAMNFNRRTGSSSSSSNRGVPTGKAIDYGRKPTQQSSGNFIPQGPVYDHWEDDPNYQGKPDPKRTARYGRPPSRWLRSLEAEELREWLKTVRPPHAGVTNMTFETHLTRDHLFKPEKIAGLTNDELAKLHSAAHAGY